VTQPLVPAEVNLRGLPWMRLDTTRLLDSDLFALSTGDEFKAAVALWCKSWTQQPAGSLPSDDRVLAHLSGAGIARWKKIKAMALRGWIEAEDGRLYHPVVAEQVLQAWAERQEYRAEVDAQTERKRRERDERAAMFERLKAAGQHHPWNTPTGKLRELVTALPAQPVTETGVTGHGDSHGLDGTGRDGKSKSSTPEGSLRAEGSGTARSLADDPPSPAPQSTASGRACLAMRRGGLIRTNPADPRLIAACAMPGATDAMWEATAREAVEAQPPKGVAWVIATVTGRIADAAHHTSANTGATHASSARNRGAGRTSLADAVVSSSTDQHRSHDDGNVIEGTATRITD
jgi:uncharacterized protein YdaU (DUF1376 family)